MKKPLISVIIPIYNVEKYLNEAVDSVINQTIGFEENVELVLVNDGSPDSSGDICREYCEKYPENVVYIEKENGGVSSARNAGLEVARGEFVNFLDADDKWKSDAFEKIIAFFRQNEGAVSVVSCKMKRFEAAMNMHRLSVLYKNKSKIIDVRDKKTCYNIHVHITSAVIKRDAIGDIRFKEDLKYSEDTLFLESVIISDGRLGLCADALHYYRRRDDKTSAVQLQRNDKMYFTELPRIFYGGMIEASIEKYGYVVPYIQSCIAYDMGWRVSDELKDELTEEEKKEYFAELSRLLAYVDDDVILKSIFHRRLCIKSAILSIKYQRNFLESFKIEKGSVVFNDLNITNIAENKGLFFVDRLYPVSGGRLAVEGRFAAWMELSFPEGGLIIEVNDDENEVALQKSDFTIDTNVFGKSQRYKTFRYEFKNPKNAVIKFYFRNGTMEYLLGINYNPLFPSCDKFECQFMTVGKNQLVKAGQKAIEISALKKEEIAELIKEREEIIGEEYPEIKELRDKAASDSKKQLWLAVGRGERLSQLERLAAGNKRLEFYSFSEVSDEFKELYTRADKLFVFTSKNAKAAIVPFGNMQKLVNDKIHFEIFGLIDGEDTGNINRYTVKSRVYKIHNNSPAEITNAYEEIKRL